MGTRARAHGLLIFLPLATLLGSCGDDAAKPLKPVVLEGHVISTTGAPIAGALVSAQDVNDAPVTGTVATDASGGYQLDVSAARNQSVKLHAAASGYENFPSGIRRSFPVDLSGAVENGPVLVVANPATEVILAPLASTAGLGSISGIVGGGIGALVVAEGPAVGSTVSGADGAYVLFNLPAGDYQVRAYAAGHQFVQAAASIVADQQTNGVELVRAGSALGSVNGNVTIVNAPGGNGTSIVLVVASTFNASLERGDVPPGLRAPRNGVPDVSGAFTITGVPAGTYKVLAAFENDGLVRDPDPNIAGTQIVEVTVNGGATSLPTSFKITGALAVASPGAGDQPELISGTPTLVWADDSSEDFYSVDVIDSHGNTIWSNPSVPGVSGGGTVSALYAGPALDPGKTYQFRATSWRDVQGTPGPISCTEGLRGVFIAQ